MNSSSKDVCPNCAGGDNNGMAACGSAEGESLMVFSNEYDLVGGGGGGPLLLGWLLFVDFGEL